VHIFLFLSLFLGSHQLLSTQAHLGEVGSYIYSLRVGGNLGLQLGTISLPLLERVGVRSLLFSSLGGIFMDIRCPPNMLGHFFLLHLDTKTTYMHGNLGLGPEDVMCKVVPWQ
jgi:hypothetical protein